MAEQELPSQQPSIPETVPEASVQDRITDLAIDLTDAQGSEDYSGEIKTAIFYVPDHETGDSKYPSLKINIPKEEVSEKYQWRAELTFGNQDPALSSHVLVKKDGSIVVTDYADGEPKVLDERQAESFFTHMKDIQGNLVEDA
ncbi:hypothetical protein KC950_02420 [Candidatus Saccharibacteria bacterium]|nr:hypothetical protein [Candidatus Saccharibacteria bacterium]